MPKPIQYKKLLLLMLLFSSSTNVFSQTIKTYIDNQWQNSRYIDHGNETVTDKKTDLMWKQCPEGGCSDDATTHTYENAIVIAKRTIFAGYRDWRLPNIKELASLTAHDRYKPAINRTLFPNTPSIYNSNFWSSSPSASSNYKSWTLNFEYGKDDDSQRNFRYHVRLVRGGQ